MDQRTKFFDWFQMRYSNKIECESSTNSTLNQSLEKRFPSWSKICFYEEQIWIDLLLLLQYKGKINPVVDREKEVSEILAQIKILNDTIDSVAVNTDDDYKSFKPDTSVMPDLCSQYYDNESINHIELALDKVKNNDYAPFVVILQSSGYGKTRSVWELAKKRKVVYLLCEDIAGGLKTPDIVKVFLKRCSQCNSQQAVETVCSKLFRAIDIVSSRFETAELLRKSQILEGYFGKFYYDLLIEWHKLHTPLISPIKEIEDKICKSQGKISTSKSQGKISTSNNEIPLVVVFDEANALFSSKGDVPESPYRCLRRVLYACENKIGVFADTSSELAQFLPPMASSDRQGGIGIFLPPVMDIPTVDVIPINTEMSYFVNLFTRGRPLWAMQLRFREGNNLTRLVQFAYSKLSGAFFGNEIPEISGKIAVFACRFGMGETSKMASKLVSHNLATLIGVNHDRTQVYFKYLSEPILAEASAYGTSKYPSILIDVLEAVCDSLNNQMISPARGDRGEMAAAAGLGFVADALRFKSVLDNYNAFEVNMSKEILAKDFLKAVCPKLTTCEPLEDFLINFTHFYRLSISPNANILPILWDRHVAIYLPAGEEGIDLLIVMKKSKTYSTIRIQIKNLKEHISNTSCEKFLLKLSPMRCAPRIAEIFSVALVIAVGDGKIEPSCKLSLCYKTKRSIGNEKATQLWLTSSLSYFDLEESVMKKVAALAGRSLSSRIMVGVRLREGNFSSLYDESLYETD